MSKKLASFAKMPEEQSVCMHLLSRKRRLHTYEKCTTLKDACKQHFESLCLLSSVYYIQIHYVASMNPGITINCVFISSDFLRN